MAQGWIKLHRKLLQNPLSDRPLWFSVWIHLLLLASHEETSFIWNGEKKIIHAGEFVTGRKKLAKICGVSPGSVEDCLKYLERQQQIQQQKTNKFRLIKIRNWIQYQNSDSESNNRKTTERQQKDTIKNVKNVKNDTEDVRTARPSARAVSERKKTENEPMDREAFIVWYKASPQRHIRIIADWADTVKPDFTTKGQWAAFSKRHLRAARSLEPFTDDQLTWAYEQIENARSDRKGFLDKPTLETLLKYLT